MLNFTLSETVAEAIEKLTSKFSVVRRSFEDFKPKHRQVIRQYIIDRYGHFANITEGFMTDCMNLATDNIFVDDFCNGVYILEVVRGWPSGKIKYMFKAL